jgi:hypothetical protein
MNEIELRRNSQKYHGNGKHVWFWFPSLALDLELEGARVGHKK